MAKEEDQVVAEADADEELLSTDDADSDDEQGDDYEGAQIVEPVLVRIDHVGKNAWNPFEETDETFNLLVEEIESEGYDEPILVVPIEGKGSSKIERSEEDDTAGWLVETGSQRYRIINGEHRWKALNVLDYEYIPCVIKADWDERTQKIQTVRRNMIKGQVNRRKMSNLIEDIRKRHKIGPEAAARKMGIFDEKEFKRYYIKKRQEQKKANEKRRQDQKAVQAVENMTTTLTQIFKESGGTVSQGFVSFAYKGEVHMLVNMDPALKRTIEGLAEFLEISGFSAPQFLHEALEAKMMQTALATTVANHAIEDDGLESDEDSSEDTDDESVSEEDED